MRRTISFSAEITSKNHVRNVSISNQSFSKVLFEGDLGEMTNMSLVDGEVLEISGDHGTLRVDISEEALRKILSIEPPILPGRNE